MEKKYEKKYYSSAMRFDVEKRTYLTKKLLELKSATLVQRAFRTKFKNETCPARSTIIDLANKFDFTGSVHDLPPKQKNQQELRLEAKN